MTFKVESVKFDGHSDTYGVSRVDLRLTNGEEVALFLTEDGKINLCASKPMQHGEFISNKGTMIKVDYFGHPFED